MQGGGGLSIKMRYSIIWRIIKLYLVRMGEKIDQKQSKIIK